MRQSNSTAGAVIRLRAGPKAIGPKLARRQLRVARPTATVAAFPAVAGYGVAGATGRFTKLMPYEGNAMKFTRRLCSCGAGALTLAATPRALPPGASLRYSGSGRADPRPQLPVIAYSRRVGKPLRDQMGGSYGWATRAACSERRPNNRIMR
jgi:hypothetical protein